MIGSSNRGLNKMTNDETKSKRRGAKNSEMRIRNFGNRENAFLDVNFANSHEVELASR